MLRVVPAQQEPHLQGGGRGMGAWGPQKASWESVWQGQVLGAEQGRLAEGTAAQSKAPADGGCQSCLTACRGVVAG